MPTLERSELLDTIIHAVEASGWNVIHEVGISDRPFRLRAYKDSEVRRLRIYIWNISHGGATRAANEYRIQVHVPKFEPEPGWQVLILGWWEDGQVFGGWDYRMHTATLGKSPSLQIKLEALTGAAINGLAPSERDNREIAIAFTPELFMEYANHAAEYHSFGESHADLQLLQTITSNQAQLQNDEIIDQVTQPRRRALQTITRALRDQGFNKRVLTAYSHRCAFCDVQLNLIQAAHIVPVSYETSTDETRNGIALCGLHHTAYDKSLITFNEAYGVVSSAEKIQTLQQIGRAGGLQRFSNALRPVINVPPDLRDRPHVAYVTRANRLRGW